MDSKITNACFLVVGVGMGYSLALKKLRERYDLMLDEEVRRTKEFFELTYKRPVEVPVEEVDDATQEAQANAVEAAASAMQDYQGHEPKVEPIIDEVQDFQRPLRAPVVVDEEWVNKGKDVTPVSPLLQTEPLAATLTKPDTEKEAEAVDSQSPYIISEDAFMANESGFEQISLTWYVGDKTLIDQTDTVVERIDDTVGEENLDRFGEESNDPNIVYVRNDRFGMDYEVARSEGKYAVEVLGLGGDS